MLMFQLQNCTSTPCSGFSKCNIQPPVRADFRMESHESSILRPEYRYTILNTTYKPAGVIGFQAPASSLSGNLKYVILLKKAVSQRIL